MICSILPLFLISFWSLSDSIPLGYCGITVSPNILFLIVDASKEGLSGSPDIGYSLGLFANKHYGKMGLRAELHLNNKHVKLNEFGYIGDLYLRTISIPLLFQMRSQNDKNIKIYFFYGISPEITINDVSIYSPFTIGFPFSFGIDYLTRKGILSVELRNTFNILKSTQVERFNALYLLLGYGFAYPQARSQKEIIEE